MKSRFLLPSNLPETHRAPSALPKTSLTRRFELQYNVSPRFERRRQSRRQGQALLLAVLIMLLAALLSAGFLAVVSGNLNQTARIADKTKAIEASRAGIVFANEQLSGSSQGDLWRPIDVSPAPPPGATGYDFYYSQLDKAQGWANQLPVTAPGYRDTAFAKFPAPDQPSSDAPKFLVKVQELTTNPGDPAYDANHAGELKITSIGLSDDDPNVFHTSIAYKDGRRKSPWASALRSISNWNFGATDKTTGVPYATVTASPYPAIPPSFPASNVNVVVDTKDAPQFSPNDVPFNVVIVKKAAPSAVIGAVVTKVTPPVSPATTATLTLAKLDSDITPAMGEAITIQKAAAIGTGSMIDLLNTGTPLMFPDQQQPRGILTNGSTWLQGQIRLSDLSKFGTKIISSGSLALDTPSKPVDAPTTPPSPNYGIAGNGTLVSSSANNFPGTFTTDSGSNVTPLDVVTDGWNKIGAQTLGLDYSTTRDVEPFKPAKIDSATNLARYRALTRNSVNGVYVDNRDDVEKVGTAPMTQAQLIEMLTSPAPTLPATPTDYTRTGTAATAATGVSLEQRHLRGWVGPDEFLARGALVELLSRTNPMVPTDPPTPFIRVTYDARSDTNFAGPELSKTFRDNNGDLQPGVYSKDFEWPRTGTLFAEGNIRIRGNVNLSNLPATANPAYFPSLTVASLGNIYIEGSVSVDSTTVTVGGATSPAPNRKKLMLLAKKNVIVNPTRSVLARTDVQTVATNPNQITLTGTPGVPGTYATAANFDIRVADIVTFNTGDYAEVVVPGVTDPIRGLIAAVNIPTNTLTIRSTATGVIPVPTVATPIIVRSPLEKSNLVTTTAMNREFFSLVNLENAINRRVVSSVIRDTGNLRNKLVFDHVGDKATPKAGLLIKAEDYDATTPRPAGFTAVLTNKQTVGAAPAEDLDHTETGVTSANKILRTYNNFQTANNTKPFNEFPTSPATVKPLSQLVTEIIGTQETTGGPTPEGYRYTASLTNPAFATLPSNALAGVGLRYEPGTVFVPPTNSPANNHREDFNENAAATPPNVGFTIPLATSVEYNLNGALSNLVTPSSSRVSKYIGFNPGTGLTDNDDALTVDSSFYQLKTDMDKKSTLDSRILNLTLSTDPTLTAFPQSIVLKRSAEMTDAATSALLPDYEVRSLKLENVDLSTNEVKPVATAMQIDAYVYAQEGSWMVIPGDYFRSDAPVRGITDGTGKLIGSYIDYNGNKLPDTAGVPDPGEYILSGAIKVADLNRNGKVDNGEKEAALRFVRYNTAPIKFYGAIVENQTAVVADVKDTAGVTLAKGAVQDWMDKWATYNDDPISNPLAGTMSANVGKTILFSFINYSYDPSLANSSVGASQLRVPITDDLIYQQ